MKSEHMRRLGDYIRQVDVRNRDLSVKRLVGLTIDKAFISSVANVIGTDLSNYKVIKRNQFACSLMQVSRDGRIPIARYEEDEAIMSPAYPMFEVTDESLLLPQYLMMWFSRSEFDREASYYAVGGVRGSLTWEDFCDMRLPIPPLSEQRRVVSEYETVGRRIRANRQLILRLEETAQALYRHTFIEGIDKQNLPEGWRMGTIGEYCKEVKSGGTPNRSHNEYWNKKDYPWLKTGEVQNNVITEVEEYISEEGLKNSSAKLIPRGTVIMAMYGGGTVGNVSYLDCETTTNQACCNMICRSKEDSALLYFHLRYEQENFKRLANGGAQENLSQEIIVSQPMLIFDDKSIKSSYAILLDEIIVKHKENQLLTSLRTLLLSRMGRDKGKVALCTQ